MHSSTETPSPVSSNPQTHAPGRWGWVVVAVLLALELTTFTTYARREITWAFPGYFDQTVYLHYAYELNCNFAEDGLPRGVRKYLSQHLATGVLLPIQGAIHGVVLGPGRLAALSVNFLHFALFQCAFVATLLWASRNWWVALAGFGLTLTLKSVFQPAGGAFDFRMDFVSFCVFGTFLCALIRSRLLLSTRWAVVVGLTATALVLFRFLTAVYLGGILSLLGASIALRWFRAADPEARRLARQRVRGWLLATGILIIGTWPVLISQRKAIEAYYVVGHVTSSEKHLRAAELGIAEWTAAALFYPRSLYESHTGRMFWLSSSVLLVAGLLGRVRRGEPAEVPPNVMRWVLPTAVLGFVVPLGILNAGTAKSPVVAVILIPALLWVVLAPLVAVGPSARTGLLRAVAILSLLSGFFTQLNFAAAPGPYRVFHQDTSQTMRAVDDLIDAKERKKYTSVVMFLDANIHQFQPLVLELMEFEKYGRLLPARDTGISLFAASDEEYFQQLDRADIVVLAGRAAGEMKYPSDEALERLRPRIKAYCDKNLTKVGEYRISGQVVTTYLRGHVRVEDITDDGWVTDKGVQLVSTLDDLKRCRQLELRPTWQANLIGRVPGVTAEVKIGDRPPQKLNAAMAEDFSAIRIDWQPVDLPPETPVMIQLRFDAFFIPRDKGIGTDPRRLVTCLGPKPRVHLISLDK